MHRKFEINGTKIKGSCQSGRKAVTREGKVERINRRPFFSSISCCLPSLVKRAQRAFNQAGQTTADSGKNWLSINSLCLTLANLDLSYCFLVFTLKSKVLEADREGKAERINRQPFFSTISCCLPSLVMRGLCPLH